MVECRGTVRLNVASTSPIKHVVIIVKENHGYDNYFGAFPGGNGVTMSRSPNPPPKDPDHRHAAWLSRDTTAPRVQFAQADIPHYWSYASEFSLCDNYFTDVAGPSTPNHLMLIMADSALINNPSTNYRKKPGPPLYDQPSLPPQLDAAGLTWGNYGGYAFHYIKELAGHSGNHTSDLFAHHATAGKLPSVAWVYSEGKPSLSEHPTQNVTDGAHWTAQQLQAIVAGHLWERTVVFITWDDWGGWFDHVVPPNVEQWNPKHAQRPADAFPQFKGQQFRYGSRVPCLVVSPYAKKGHVSKTPRSHISVLKFCETLFGVASIHPRLKTADDMMDCFDPGQAPLPPPVFK